MKTITQGENSRPWDCKVHRINAEAGQVTDLPASSAAYPASDALRQRDVDDLKALPGLELVVIGSLGRGCLIAGHIVAVPGATRPRRPSPHRVHGKSQSSGPAMGADRQRAQKCGRGFWVRRLTSAPGEEHFRGRQKQKGENYQAPIGCDGNRALASWTVAVVVDVIQDLGRQPVSPPAAKPTKH